MEYRFIYTTTGSREEAKAIGRRLLEQRLVACVNILPEMNSLYSWEGEVQDDSEAVMICKTTAEQAGRVMAAIRELHSYDCPCAVSLPVLDGNPAFLDWIAEQVRPSG